MPQVNVKLWLFEYRNIGTNGFLRDLNRLMVSVFSVSVCDARTHMCS